MSEIQIDRIQIKALSVNECWQGRRFKTKAYLSYEKEMLFRLRRRATPSAPLRLIVGIGFSNAQSDLDNVLKPLLDILQKKYGFNDKDVHEILLRKHKAKKGEEWIAFNLESMNKYDLL